MPTREGVCRYVTPKNGSANGSPRRCRGRLTIRHQRRPASSPFNRERSAEPALPVMATLPRREGFTAVASMSGVTIRRRSFVADLLPLVLELLLVGLLALVAVLAISARAAPSHDAAPPCTDVHTE